MAFVQKARGKYSCLACNNDESQNNTVFPFEAEILGKYLDNFQLNFG
jgi:hypothetical protein